MTQRTLFSGHCIIGDFTHDPSVNERNGDYRDLSKYSFLFLERNTRRGYLGDTARTTPVGSMSVTAIFRQRLDYVGLSTSDKGRGGV